MSMQKNVELSDHPLFRALVLMGGSLAIGCGGVAEREAPESIDVGRAGSASGGAASNGAAGSVGGTPFTIGSAGALTQLAAGATSLDAAAFYNPTCPYPQWDCGVVQPGYDACYLNLTSKDDPRAAGCSCDSSRPTSADACKSDESFVCRQAFPPYTEAQPTPSTWDGTLHVQCACVATPTPTPTWDNCTATCSKAYPVSGAWTRCSLPSASTCDDRGVCTATSADVLRQDGILCGCAAIALK